LNSDEEFPGLVEYRLKNWVSIIIRYSKSDHLDLRTKHVIRKLG